MSFKELFSNKSIIFPVNAKNKNKPRKRKQSIRHQDPLFFKQEDEIKCTQVDLLLKV